MDLNSPISPYKIGVINMDKPKIFIGSSTESLKIAKTIQENLEHVALCKVWTQGIFELSGNALDNLVNATLNYDFAIFVFKPDDITKIRDMEVRTVRDNLIFELGLFIGKLGKERVYFLVPRNTDKLHLPSDLLGIEPGRFDYPKNDNDLLGALGPFCNKIERKLEKLGKISPNEVENVNSQKQNEEIVHENQDKEQNDEQSKFHEYGVYKDSFGNYVIVARPTDFFAHRISQSYPGIRGLHWFDDSELALDRLQILLKEPLRFEKSDERAYTDPFWWFRGRLNSFIRGFQRLSDTKCLINYHEIDINRIAVYNSGTDWDCFIYIESNPDKPIGVYEYTKTELEAQVEVLGFASESYGLFEGIPITALCYNDGAAVIDGKVVETSGAEFRKRYLTKYNFIITSKFSPINTREFDIYSSTWFNDYLKGNATFEEMLDFIKKLGRHELDE